FNSPLVLRFDAHGNPLPVSGSAPVSYSVTWLRSTTSGGAVVAGVRTGQDIPYATISAEGDVSAANRLTVARQADPFVALAVDTAGGFYATGPLHRADGGSDVAVARFLPSGELDPEYAIARIPLPPDGSPSTAHIYSAALDSQQRLVVAGETSGGVFLAR